MTPLQATFEYCLAPSLNLTSEHWQLSGSFREDLRLLNICDRHYSCKDNQRGVRLHAYGPGVDLALMTPLVDAAFVWLYERYRRDGQAGINCVIFRNESLVRSSLLIEEAVELAWLKWPQTRLFTFVNAEKIQSANPGYCFKKAGFEHCGESAKGLVILERLP